MSCFVAFHYRSYGTFFLHKNRLHNIHRGFTHYKYYRDENSHLIYADYFEMKLQKLLKDDTKVFEKSTFKFVEGYKIYLTESKESGIKQMDNVIKYFEFIESKSIALYFQKRLNELID
ncbi:putative transcriptional regulator [Streptococcus pneumoniae]|nr:putative transcriptional regulator [Streptococcus pneumoniae]